MFKQQPTNNHAICRLSRRKLNLGARRDHISQNLQIQWQDHFHMRDQTWKVLQYSIFFFLGVIGLEIKGVDPIVLMTGYIAVLSTAVSGIIVAIHHRIREKEKFKIIGIYEHELKLDTLLNPVLKNACKGIFGMNTAWYIVGMQIAIFAVSLALLIKRFIY